MSMENLSPRVEYAIAAAAAASFQLLRPIRLEDDVIAKHLAWRPDIEQLDAHIGSRLQGIESLPRILRAGDSRAVWRYRYFELAVRPTQTDCQAVLKAVSAGLLDRGLSGGCSGGIATRGVGSFLLGPLGVIELPRVSWVSALETVHYTYQSWEWETTPAEVADRSAIEAGRVVDLFDGSGWSDRWRGWFLNDYCSPVHRGEISLWQGERGDWAPANNTIPARLSRFGTGLIDVLLSDHDELVSLVEACVQECRAEFFDGVIYDFSVEARKALLEPGAIRALDRAALWQLLHVARPESLIAIARERRLVPAPIDTVSFAEELANGLIDARDRSEDPSILDHLLHAHGSKYDQVLHRVLRTKKPNELLTSLLVGNPRLARCLAKVTSAPLRFQSAKSDAWDHTSDAEQGAFVMSVAEAFGFQEVPRLNSIVHPLRQLGHPIDREQLQAHVGKARRRVEWILKTASQYIYQIIRISEVSRRVLYERAHLGVWSFVDFESDEELRKWAAAQSPPIVLGRLTGTQLSAVHLQLCSSVSEDAPLHLKKVRDSQRDLMKEYGRSSVARAGNLGAHDNQATPKQLMEAYEAQRMFDDGARRNLDVLPGFVRFMQELREVNKPSEVTVEPISDFDIDIAAGKRKHYVSRQRQPGELRGSCVYSFTDVTRNEISVNPIVIDWTEYVREVS